MDMDMWLSEVLTRQFGQIRFSETFEVMNPKKI